MDKIAKQKLAIIYSFQIYGGSFLPVSCLKYLPNTLSRKLPVKEKYRVHYTYPKVRVGWLLMNTKNCATKNLYINPNPKKLYRKE